MSCRKPCPNAAAHNAPSSEDLGYVDWHDWAERKSKTHKQIRCEGCGLFKIWVPLTATSPPVLSEQAAEPFVGWALIHEAAGKGSGEVEVCVGSEPFVHRFGQVVMVTDEDFTLATATARNRVAWADVRAAWRKQQVPNLCPICSEPEQGEAGK